VNILSNFHPKWFPQMAQLAIVQAYPGNHESFVSGPPSNQISELSSSKSKSLSVTVSWIIPWGLT
jgi:hypothetical protein